MKINLIKGEFTPTESIHLITNLIDEKINFHKIERLQRLEGNQNSNTEDLFSRIEESEKERKEIVAFLIECKEKNKSVTIKSTIEVNEI